MSIDLGDVYELAYDHYVGGALASATAATWTVTLPDGTTSSMAASTIATGMYRDNFTTTQAGRHLALWQGTGANAGAYETVFNVSPQGGGGLISLDAAKTQLNIAASSTVHDEELRRYILGITDAIEREMGEVTVPRTIVERRRLPRPTDRVQLAYVPPISLTSVASFDGDTTWTVESLDLDTSKGIITVLDGDWLSGDLVLTYRAGYVVMPDNVLLAARMVLQDMWRMQRAAPGGPRIVGANEDARMLIGGVRILSPEAKQLLREPIPGIA